MPLKLALRALVTGAIEVAALGVLTRVVPGVHVADLEIGVLAIVVIGLLNAVLRPVVVLLAINLGLALSR